MCSGITWKEQIHLFYRNIKNLKRYIICFLHTQLKSMTEHRVCALLSSILCTNSLNSWINARSNADTCQREGKVVAVVFLLVPEWRTCWSCCGWRCCSSFQTGGFKDHQGALSGVLYKIKDNIISLLHYLTVFWGRWRGGWMKHKQGSIPLILIQKQFWKLQLLTCSCWFHTPTHYVPITWQRTTKHYI